MDVRHKPDVELDIVASRASNMKPSEVYGYEGGNPGLPEARRSRRLGTPGA